MMNDIKGRYQLVFMSPESLLVDMIQSPINMTFHNSYIPLRDILS